MTKEQKAKTKFRRSSAWKKFRKQMKDKNKVDYITQKPLYAGWNLHHCDMEAKNYENLEEDNFACLNRTSHEFVHWLFRYSDWREVLNRTAELLEKMESLNK